MKIALLGTPARRVGVIALCVVAGSLPLVESAAAAPPTIDSLTVTPAPPLTRPVVGEQASFGVTVTWGGKPGTVSWDFGDGSVVSGPSLTRQHAYGAAKNYELSVTATNGDLVPETTLLPAKDTVRVNTRPAAAFVFSPADPIPGQGVLFGSRSSDPDGDGLSHQWTFGDGVTSTLPGPTHPFATLGSRPVTLIVTDPFGATDVVTNPVVVRAPVPPPATPTGPVPANAPPSAAFAFSPRTPTAGQQAEFVSSALDPEGRLKEQRWDLDGDGEFDDARGDEVLYTFASPGQKTVRLRVEDAAGAAAVRERTFTVGAGPVARAGFLSPFPVVRLTGEVRGRGAKVRLLSVRAPRGSSVRVSCDGKGCPVKNKRRSVRKGSLRFRIFERMFRAGTKLEIFVRKPGAIGKYTSFAIRAGDSPKRTDRCLSPGVKRPRRCGAP